MATLKISDLSAGDWVRYKGKECTIASIYMAAEGYPHEVALTYQGICCGCAYIDHLEPIPITAEILEKNGLFRHARDAGNPESIVLSNHFIMARTYTDVDWWRVLIYDGEFPAKELFNGIIYSVHQLQHALRLAGVDKEINL
ncbi:MAG: hypothetical protein J6R02_05725 [Alistipes sp.]|nr:hypothetical protein [Alistipes sp.]